VLVPARRVVMWASSVSTAKCTSVRLGKEEDGLARVAVMAVLVNGIGRCLAGKGIFQLQRHHGNAVDRQHHIQRFFVFAAVIKLPGDPQPVGTVARLQIRIEPVGRAEKAMRKVLPKHLKPWRRVVSAPWVSSHLHRACKTRSSVASPCRAS
jgi:hypothetical protein